MVSNNEKIERFPKTLKIVVSMLLRIKGALARKYIYISIAHIVCNNYVSV
jgi:hypothetical protein